MFSLLLKGKRAIKRSLKVRTRRRIRRDLGRERLVRMSVFAGAILATGLLFPQGDLLAPFSVPGAGSIAERDFIAETVITLKKTGKELDEERRTVSKTLPVVLDFDSTVVDSAFRRLRRFTDRAASLRDSLASDSAADLVVYAEILTQTFPSISSVALREAYFADSLEKVYEDLSAILSDEIYFTGALGSLDDLGSESLKPVVVRIGGRETILPRSQALDLNRAREVLLNKLNALARDNPINVELYYEIGRNFIFPNLSLALGEMRRREQEALAQVSEIKVRVEEGDLILRAGQTVEPTQVIILQEYSRKIQERLFEENPVLAYAPILVRLALVAIIFGLLYLYLKVFREDIFRSIPKLLATLLIVGIALVALYIGASQGWENMFLYPVALAPIMFSVLFDTRFGVVSSFFVAMLLGALAPFDFGLALYTVCAGSVGAYSVAEVRQRAQLFRTMLYLAVVGAALALVIRYLTSLADPRYADFALASLASAVYTPILAAGLLPFFESLFGFTTDITLLELSDLNRPLLKRLALEAPGTFHHSIVVGSLAEAAAKEIDANSLLARVGAYYHDVGKMEIAEYFVENQVGMKSKHDTITPSMSAIILVSHVKRGRQLAEEADLPDEVMNFIEEHHGTMAMTYFYNKAIEQGAAPDVLPEFQYPGPKPQTKEAAILMLADGVEAASRTLEDPKPARISALAQKIVDQRYHSGQLEDCPLTTEDLGKIRDAFTQILTGVFHQRVEYPSVRVAAGV
ncbi:MAG: HD family phosphohydrolase [Candidatus Zixiibacteriota bacterium]